MLTSTSPSLHLTFLWFSLFFHSTFSSLFTLRTIIYSYPSLYFLLDLIFFPLYRHLFSLLFLSPSLFHFISTPYTLLSTCLYFPFLFNLISTYTRFRHFLAPSFNLPVYIYFDFVPSFWTFNLHSSFSVSVFPSTDKLKLIFHSLLYLTFRQTNTDAESSSKIA